MLSGMTGRGMWHPPKHSVNLTHNLQSFKNLHTASIEVCSLTDLIMGRSPYQTEIWTLLWKQWPATTRHCTHTHATAHAAFIYPIQALCGALAKVFWVWTKRGDCIWKAECCSPFSGSWKFWLLNLICSPLLAKEQDPYSQLGPCSFGWKPRPPYMPVWPPE